MTNSHKYHENVSLIQGYAAFLDHCGLMDRRKLNREIERLASQNRKIDEMDRYQKEGAMEFKKLIIPSELQDVEIIQKTELA